MSEHDDYERATHGAGGFSDEIKRPHRVQLLRHVEGVHVLRGASPAWWLIVGLVIALIVGVAR